MSGPPLKMTVTTIEKSKVLSKAEQSYTRLVEFVELSHARSSHEFIDWGLSPTDQALRDEICFRYFFKTEL